MKKLLWLPVVFILLTLLPASSQSATGIATPTACPACESRDLTLMYTAWFTSTLPKLNHGVWRCEYGHLFDHYPEGSADAAYGEYSAPEPVYPEEGVEGWHALPLPIP